MKIALARGQSFALAVALLSSVPTMVGGQNAASDPPFPAPGRLIDVGGWRLHLYCLGEPRPDQPTVILEAGLGDFSVEWALVQTPVASFARVCSYDRAGDGWSDLGPHPRTMRQVVYELHTLVERAAGEPPYVLVGHSYGGWLVRLYQQEYPAEVVGMVLVDPGETDPLRLTPDGREVRSSELASGRNVPAVKSGGPLRESDIPPEALRQMRAGLSAASARANEPPRDKLPESARQMRTWALGQLGHVAAAVNPFELEELAALRAASEGREDALGGLPLTVVTRGLSEEAGPSAAAREEQHRRDHALLAAMSRSGRLIIAEAAGHHVHLDQPDLIVQTIQELLNATRR